MSQRDMIGLKGAMARVNRLDQTLAVGFYGKDDSFNYQKNP